MGKIAETPFRVVFLLVDGFALMSYASVIEPMRAANQLAGRKLYHWVHVAVDGEIARTSTGALVPAKRSLEVSLEADLVLVVAAGDPMAYENATLFAWLRHLAARGVTLGGVSGGPVLLAKAGVMAGRRMTVHWEHAPALAEMDPDLLLSRVLYVMDRDRLTCAGGMSPLDMMHALLAQHHGAEFARLVSDWFVHTDIRPAGGPMRAGAVERYGVSSPVVVEVIEQMQTHIADPLSLTQLGLLVGRTGRQLNRLFADALARSTMAFYRELRLDHARQLLGQTTLSVTETGLACGFSSGAHFASAFRGRFGMSPRASRAMANRG